MKNIEKWLSENDQEYSRKQYGDSTYFNDGFSVQDLAVSFYTDGIGIERCKAVELERYIARRKSYVCIWSRFGASITCRI